VRDRAILIVQQDGPLRPAGRLQLDVGLDGPGERVEDGDRPRAFLKGDADLAGERLHGGVERPVGDGHCFAVGVAGVIVGAFQAGPGQDVVELVEEHALPGPLEVGGVGQAGCPRRQQRPLLRRQQAVLRQAVPALDAGVGGVAAGGVLLQIAMHDRQRQVSGLDGAEERLRRTAHHARGVRVGVQAVDALDVGSGRAAAVIAHAVEAHKLVQRGLHLSGAAADVMIQLLAPGQVLERDAEGQHPRAVIRLPPEQAARQALLVGHGAQEGVVVQPALLEDLRQRPAVAEAVDVEADARRDAELLLEVTLPDQALADERLAAGDVAVRLDPPAAGDLPAPFGHALPDLLEHGRIGAFHPLVEGRRAGDEDEVAILGHAIQSRAEGRPHLLEAFLPGPQPDRVDVGIADHVQGGVLHGLSRMRTFRRHKQR